MRSFIAACAAAIAIAIIGGFVLDSVQKQADSAFATTGARI